jgi:hypothetical protein
VVRRGDRDAVVPRVDQLLQHVLGALPCLVPLPEEPPKPVVAVVDGAFHHPRNPAPNDVELHILVIQGEDARTVTTSCGVEDGTNDLHVLL